MNAKLKKLLTNWRVLLLIALLIISLLLLGINPGREGAAIRSVEKESSADLAGIENTDSNARPLSREVILNIDGSPVINANDYYELTKDAQINDTLVIKTNVKTYSLTVLPEYRYTTSNETIPVERDFFNETTNETYTVMVEEPIILEEVIGIADLGLNVYDAPTSNIRKGLDLQGGTRVLLSPEDSITPEQFESIKSSIETRLNVYGLADVDVSIVKNFEFEPEFIMIEIAGTTVNEIEALVSEQGKFEAKVGDVVVFEGEDNDIAYVGKGATEARVENCGSVSAGVHSCRFSFQIKLTSEAATKFGEATAPLAIINENGNQYLEKEIELYLDGEMIDSLKISASLRGNTQATDILISGSGNGTSRKEATENTAENMKKLQTVIETGSLPTKLNIVKVDSISAVLGKNFLINAMLAGLAAIAAVAIVLFIRYRRLSIIIPMVVALVSEVILILGSSVFINWTLDLAAIAGIIIAIGTGIDHLVVITDEVNKGKETISWQAHIKKAFAIVLGAYLTTVFAMVPLLIAGAGLLKGFAITTILGLTFGVFITRPVYAKVIEVMRE